MEYITGYGEDLWLAGTFTYRLKGYKEQPTPHYTRPFYQMTEEMFSTLQCFGSENSFDVWARYCNEFLTKYPKNLPKFGVFHYGAFSDDSISDIQNLDEKIKIHFENLYNDGYFENTVVFVGSDHGHRFSASRETQQGQLEERLPFMSIILPEKFKKTDKGNNVFTNLKNNVNYLSSPFDIYATFLDILNLHDDLTSLQNTANRSLSLFRPILETGTCKDADIEPHWCTCLKWETADRETARLLAEGVVDAINDYTSAERRLCASLKLDLLIRYEMLVPDKKIPGNAKYEATVQYDSKSNILTVDVLAISHVNKYGDTPHCIIDKNFFMATYCVCYDKIRSRGS
uniref:Sulfatase N-terminal domain-containing protein n=1 Tax=Panagrolaimus sp. PS1159 TaxID=55785 RepID=A0AC35ETG0_9BILA